MSIINDSLCESIYFKRDSDGYKHKYKKSNFRKDFMIIDEYDLPDPKQLNKSDINAINEQQNFHNYKKTIQYIKTGTSTWGLITTIVGMGHAALKIFGLALF